MTVERRSRVTLLLPAPTTPEDFRAVDSILTDLIAVEGGGGATATLQNPPVVEGWWYDAVPREVVRDANMLVFADVRAAVDSPALIAFLEALKLRAQRQMRQEIIWVTLHEIHRVATHDRER